MTIHLPEYIKNKYDTVPYQKALPIFADLGVPMLEAKKKPK